MASTATVEEFALPICPTLLREYSGHVPQAPTPECRAESTNLALLVSPNEDVPIIPLVERRFALPPDHHDLTWLDESSPAARAYTKSYGGHLTDNPEATSYMYYTISSSVHDQIKDATAALHTLFVRATEHVLLNPDKYWHNFDFPAEFWPMALKSFEKKEKPLTGRFDFSISDRGVKCYEYNADSASCLFECGVMQKAVFDVGSDVMEGIEGGAETAEAVTAAWRGRYQDDEEKNPIVHFMRDPNDIEEGYHMAYMIELAEAAGVVAKVIDSVQSLSFNSEGHVMDSEGFRIQNLWKTWSYTTLLSQLETEGPLLTSGSSVRLIDLCFSEHVTVIEPVWTAITANKAILPVLFELYPQCPYLLESSMKLTSSLKKAAGYVTKPISGRCGENVTLHVNKPEEFDEFVEEVDLDDGKVFSEGRFDECALVYQELCPLIRINDNFIQLNTFCAGGRYAGTVLRVDETAIIGKNSDSYPLRVTADDSM